jgi:Domain of unknown function (DUF4397)
LLLEVDYKILLGKFVQLNLLHKIKQLKMRKTTLKLASFVILSMGLTFAACEKKETKAKLMVIHASPNAPGVDLLVENVKQNTAALTFPNNTAYLDVITGKKNIKVNVTGTTTTVINADLTFEENKNYSVFAADSVAKISAVLLTDDLTTPAAGKAHVRFVHLSPNAPAVDVAVTGGAVVFPNTLFKGSTAFTPLTAGTYNLEVRVAGTTTVALPLPGIALTAGKIYTVFAKGFLGGTGAQALGAGIIVNN